MVQRTSVLLLLPMDTPRSAVFEIPAFTISTGVYARDQTFGEAFAQVSAPDASERPRHLNEAPPAHLSHVLLFAPQLREDWWSATQAGWLVWGPASAVTFRFVPQQWQLTALYTVGAVWCCVISTLSFDPAAAAVSGEPPLTAPALVRTLSGSYKKDERATS